MRLKALLASLLSLCAVSAYAQFKASLQGTVLDPKGGVVAGAKVTVTNQDTGTTRDTAASAEGFYRISELPPGKYTVTVEAAGFRKVTAKNVEVQAEAPRGLDISFQSAPSTDPLPVSSSPLPLHTQNARLSTPTS